MAMIYDGIDLGGPSGVNAVQGPQFDNLKRRVRTTAIVVHETVTRTAELAYRVLRRRGLSAHIVTDLDGTLVQHADLASRCSHAGGRLNPRSIANEVVNPYYPRHVRTTHFESIAAPWAHEGAYVLPTPASAEACSRWIEWMTAPRFDGTPAFGVPRRWPGVVEGRMTMGRLARSTSEGILAHTYSGHADGAWLVLYAWLRIEAKLEPTVAFAEARRRATGVRLVDIRDLLPRPRLAVVPHASKKVHPA